MLPPRLEYLFLLAVLVLVGLSLFWDIILRLFRLPEFWLSNSIFVLTCGTIDYFAVRMEWWAFSAQRTCGLKIAEIPIEEFLLFFWFFSFTVCIWEDSKIERS